MILAIHIITALSSLVFATVTAVTPTHQKLNTTYGLMTATLISGIVLLFSAAGHLMSACVSGIFYFGFIFVPVTIAHRKLAIV